MLTPAIIGHEMSGHVAPSVTVSPGSRSGTT